VTLLVNLFLIALLSVYSGFKGMPIYIFWLYCILQIVTKTMWKTFLW